VGRSAASIQTEITAIESQLSTAVVGSTISSDGTTITQQQYDRLTDRLDKLYIQLDRVSGNAPMIVRGVVKGLR
jgi:hypothetical protein